MKKMITVAALFTLAFATGFTCSKHAPEQTSSTTTTTTTMEAPQAGMAAATPSADPSMAQPGSAQPTQAAPTTTH